MKMFKRFLIAIVDFFKGNKDKPTPKPIDYDEQDDDVVVVIDDDIEGPEEDSQLDTWIELAMNVTGTFEGSGYGQITGNFDKQGLSAGMFQWCLGQGSLQSRILKPVIEKHGISFVNRFFPQPIAGLADMSTRESKRFATKHFLRGNNVKTEWKKAWVAFMTSKQVIEQQVIASKIMGKKAYGYCIKHDMVTPKAFCFFFDIVVQNGSLKSIGKPHKDLEEYEGYLDESSSQNAKYWSDSVPSEEAIILAMWAGRRANRNKWRKDVLSRKLTIAHGQGVVHGNYMTIDFKSLTVSV